MTDIDKKIEKYKNLILDVPGLRKQNMQIQLPVQYI